MFPSIGVDLLHLPRLTSIFTRRPPSYLHRFARRILTPTELTHFRSLLPPQPPSQPTPEVIRFLGVRWAAKEAAFKAGGPRLWKQVEVRYEESGKPYLKVWDGEVEGEGDGREGGLSISHDGEYVVAMAMIPPMVSEGRMGGMTGAMGGR